MKKTFPIAALMFTALLNMLTSTSHADLPPTVTGGYPFTVSSSGQPDNQNLSVTVSPDVNSVGNPGSVYVFSIARDGKVWSFTPNTGWDQVSVDDPNKTNGLPSVSVFRKLKPFGYYNQLPATLSIKPIMGEDVANKIGKVIYAGYGANPSLMYKNKSYSAVYTEAPTTTRSGLTVCKDTQFALCASSTCQALNGKTVTDNQGFTFPAASCICPIVRHDNIADLTLGNQVGSCVSPEPGMVYSTYSLVSSYPQQVNGVWTPDVPAAPPGGCAGPASYAQCWNWKCKVTEPQNGIPLAECTCPIQSSQIWLEGSSNNSCNALPVGAAIPAKYDPTATN